MLSSKASSRNGRNTVAAQPMRFKSMPDCAEIRGQNRVEPETKKPRRTGVFQNQVKDLAWEFGAQKRTRTSTPFRVPAPEAGASTN
ncbi:hypothetical protein, partial [Ensifer sp.]|uniref:hypothetical protein n=1 Tax=Ensifer sp. TaxID=1872086 RepID=UPI002E10D463|nr:hypothetical protein [Ensifer sp.]